MKLITEEVNDIQFLVEDDKSGGKQHYIKGIFMQAEVLNKNGRVYPKHILERECARYNKEYVQKNRALGELSHPDNPQINLDRVSHMITELYPDGNNYMGKAKILDTPNGKIVKSLLDSGVSLGVSTRGVGSLKPLNGYQQVQDDYKLACAADIVSDPSAPSAFIQGIMENYDWWQDSLTGEWHKRYIEESRKQIRKASKSEIEEVSLQIFENFIRKLK